VRVSGVITLLMLFWTGNAVNAAPQADAGTLDELLTQVRESRAVAAKTDSEREQRFLSGKETRQQRLKETRAALLAEQTRSSTLQQAFDENEKRIIELEQRLHERSGSLNELSGIYRQVWGDTRAILDNSIISTQLPGRMENLDGLALQQGLPSISQLTELWFALQQEMTAAGKVVSYPAQVIAADGSAQQQRITRVGSFNAVSNGKFLRYLPETGKLEALPKQPPARYRRMAAALEQSGSGSVPMVIDPSRGTVLDLLMQVPDVGERIMQGRLIGYIIIALALVGILVVVERAWRLTVIGRRIKTQLGNHIPNTGNPLGRVMAVYHDNKGIDTETLELKIDEAIIKNTPMLQRGLGTIKILAVIAPMLGLLGTVTGLIETFQSITLFGTGDPRLMAGGISQALVTTVLGLGAAIPLILLHTALSGKSKQLVGILEEQSAGIIATHAEQERPHAACA
jgi:biopolymer transport protein ExbB